MGKHARFMVGLSRAAAALMVAGAGAAIACSSDSTAPTRPVGVGCVVASDCSDPLVCAYQRCHAQCVSSKDCASGLRCIGSSFPKLGICLLDDESTCGRNADCPKPLVCGRRLKCEEQCKDDRDCFGAQVCSKGSCAQPEEVPDASAIPPGKTGETCLYNSDCNAPLVCRSGLCADECRQDVDCRLGESCTATSAGSGGTCRPGGPADGGPSDAADTGAGDGSIGDAGPLPGLEGAPCTYGSDCASPFVCRSSGRCGYECVSDADCAAPLGCAAHACVIGARGLDGGEDSGDASPDAGDAGEAGDASGGKVCVDYTTCDDGRFCNGLERCFAGRCAPAADAPCDSHSSCTLDTCDEPTKTCKHTTMATFDADGDKHLDVACGGDDCDDHDPTTFAGAPERCDGKDNNCNKLIDDYAVVPRGVAVQDTLASAHTSGVGALTTTGYVRVAANGSGAAAQTVSATGAAGVDKDLFATGGITALALAGSPTNALMIYDRAGPLGTTATRQATIVNADLTTGTTITLVSESATWGGEADAIWTGTQYAIAYAQPVAGTSGTQFTEWYGFVQADGTFTGGKLFPEGRVRDGNARIAFNGTNYAVVYSSYSGFPEMAILSLGGDVVVGPINVTPGSGGSAVAVAGAVGGFVVLTAAPNAYFVSNAGVVGTPVPIAGTITSAHGASDARGAAFAAKGPDGARFLYARDRMEDGIESSLAYAPATAASGDQLSFGALDGRFGIFYFAATDQHVHMLTAACLP